MDARNECCVCSDARVCESCLQAFVRAGKLVHPVTNKALPVCKCGKYFGTECRQNALWGTKEFFELTDDPVENRRRCISARYVSNQNEHGICVLNK